MDQLERAKLLALFVCFVCAIFFGLIPLSVRNFILSKTHFSERQIEMGLSCCMCYGAGVLFATVFLHIFPETKESFNELMEDGVIKQIDYPIAELTMCLGFAFIYFLEELLHICITHDEVGHKNPGHIPIKYESTGIQARTDISDNKGLVNAVAACGTIQHVETLSGSEKTIIDVETPVIISETHLAHSQKTNNAEISVFRSAMTIAALSLHSCFEGLALGLEDTPSGVWLFCLAVSSHKSVIAFCLGMEMLEIEIKKKLYYVQIIIFSIASPLGGLVGTILYDKMNDNHDTGTVVIACLQSISAGTIIFVVFCEVLERERTKPEGGIQRFFSFFAGFILMACLQMLDRD